MVERDVTHKDLYDKIIENQKEIIRLKGHIENLEGKIAADEEWGKKLSRDVDGIGAKVTEFKAEFDGMTKFGKGAVAAIIGLGSAIVALVGFWEQIVKLLQ